MADPHIDELFRELAARGLISAHPPPQRVSGGNQDRRTTGRQAWVAALPRGGRAKLTVAPDLGTLPARHAALAAACPGIIPAIVFHLRLPGGDVLAEEFFEGLPLPTALQRHPHPSVLLQQVLATAGRELAASERKSSEDAQAAEWHGWSTRLLQSDAFSSRERALLADTVLPVLYAEIRQDHPVVRCSNGDFMAGNLLVDESGKVRLIDFEFAGDTHFFGEDAVRFRVLSSGLPEAVATLASADLPDRGPAWHLYFWLRQLLLESEHNTVEYLQRVRLRRLAAIRRLAEFVTGGRLDDWSVPAEEVHFAMESAYWLQTPVSDLHVAGWCHAPGLGGIRGVTAAMGDRRLAWSVPIARADVQAHFAGNAAARQTGFQLAVPLPEPDATVTLSVLGGDGTVLPFHRMRAGDLPRRGPVVQDYAAWAAKYDPDPSAPERPPAAGPLFSILLPVYRTPRAFLEACLASVLHQYHTHWELIVVDDGSNSAELTALLQGVATDQRIRLHPRKTNGGIARATNDALSIARGEFIVMLDHDDLLRPHTLSELATALRDDPSLDAVYTDEDKINEDGQRVTPFLKPDYSPEFLLAVMYVGHALCVRTSVARAAGGFDPSFDGVQDYEFFLRVTEHTRRIAHLPRILYHWRQSAASSALHGNVKGDMDRKQLDAVAAHLHRRGDTRRAQALGRHRVRLLQSLTPTFEVVPVAAGRDALTDLRAAASKSTAEVMIMISGDILLDESWTHPLAALAGRPDSGCVAPVLLAREGKVLESGRAVRGHIAVPIMRGFDPAGDGYNGSLLCDREVDVVSQHCVAIRRELVNQSDAATWPAFCASVRATGSFHRVCAAAHARTLYSWRDAATPVETSASNCFFNPHFDSRHADYRLAEPPVHLAPSSRFQFHIDEPAPIWRMPRNFIVRGWCFASDGQAVSAVRLHAAGMVIDAVTGMPRPDVKQALAAAPDEYVGFEIRGTLPSGQVPVRLEARLADGGWSELFRTTAHVTRQRWPLWLGGGDWRQLILFQMPAHMTHAPRAIVPEKFPKPRRSPTQPKLCIVTPSYQQARFLPESMRSVLDQTGVACDYYVQDGGSTDGSKAVLEQFAVSVAPVPRAENQVRLCGRESAPDGGQADAIKRAFARTRGEPDDVMAWINSDDFYLPGALAYVAGYFARHPKVDLIYGHRVVVDESSREIGRWFMPAHDAAVLRLNDFVPQETMFWRRRLWDRVGGIDPSFKFALDWDLLLRFQAAGANIVRVPYFLGCFRIHAAQKTSAAMHHTGQREIDRLRTAAQGRTVSTGELEHDPRLLRYLRKSALIEFLWKLGVRAP